VKFRGIFLGESGQDQVAPKKQKSQAKRRRLLTLS
jgi:hypothetical protein